MVSSTFTDLKEHRASLIKAISKHKLHPNVMENDSAKLIDVLDSSLKMVQDSAAYIGVISHKYGQTPECPERNPDQLSITELEFNEAKRLGRPILLFIMGEDHPGTKRDFEQDPTKIIKLNAFRERAKLISSDSAVQRVYAVFESLEDFEEKINTSLSELKEYCNSTIGEVNVETLPIISDKESVIPAPPALYAEPDYIGSHKFVGRQAELDTLSDWANGADPTNLLLFEAIGGTGKSMLTWEWTTRHANGVRSDWAGRFWYSFYERGAYMQDFCQNALAYMTGRPLDEFKKCKTTKMMDELIFQLHSRPWLLILDGLERVLVAYHRIDASEVSDEEVDSPMDRMLNRNPCDAIRDEDNDLLRAFAACAPSKILISSRLTPRILLNPAGQAISGAKRITLPGLRPPDADKLLRSCEISGDSTAIRNYLQENCDNHPLVIGILGGLIANYLPDRGNFDTWVADPNGGAALDLASLDLTQRRNHILRAAIADLPAASRQLLSTLALLTESVDYETLTAFNPHRPSEPKKVDVPIPPEERRGWSEDLTKEAKNEFRQQYEVDLMHRQDFEQALKVWQETVEGAELLDKLSVTVGDLEERGLLQYDGLERRYDLHPVVRCVAAGEMKEEDKQRYGQQVINFFEAQPHIQYEQAQTLEELSPGLQVVRTLIKLGKLKRAASVYRNGLNSSLLFNLESYAEVLTLLRPFFPTGWDKVPSGLTTFLACHLVNEAAFAIQACGDLQKALVTYEAGLQFCLQNKREETLGTFLTNISSNLLRLNRIAKSHRLRQLSRDYSTVAASNEHIFLDNLLLFNIYSEIGKCESAKMIWQQLDPMGRNWTRKTYRQGTAEFYFARWCYVQGILEESHLMTAADLAELDQNRHGLRLIHRLSGIWRLEKQDWTSAFSSFQEAVRMARESRVQDSQSETGVALVKFQLGQITADETRSEAKRLAALRQPANYYLALLWLELDDPDQAKEHALAAYNWAWADGEPYVHRYELTKTTELLQQMNVPIPQLTSYDPDKDKLFSWEADVRALIVKLNQEKESQENQ